MSLCIRHLAVPGGHPSNYEIGVTLLNFCDIANTDERTRYSVLAVLKAWTRVLDSSNAVDAIYLDFRKAFDTVGYRTHTYGRYKTMKS